MVPENGVDKNSVVGSVSGIMMSPARIKHNTSRPGTPENAKSKHLNDISGMGPDLMLDISKIDNCDGAPISESNREEATAKA